MTILFAIAASLYFFFRNYMIYKFSESGIFFLGPVIIQAVMYSVICKRLFVGTKELHRKQNVRTGNGNQKEKDSDAIKARKGVVKMLIASVLVYFISYAPTQVPLFYNVISPVPFSQNWSFLVLVMTLGYVNSAANPILYMIFSQKFRQKFFYVLVTCLGLRERYMKLRKPPLPNSLAWVSHSSQAEHDSRGGETRRLPFSSLSARIFCSLVLISFY